MKTFIPVVLFLIFSHVLISQKPLKKKYLGLYQGEIPAYKINTGDLFIDVSPSKITVELKKSGLKYSVGRNQMEVEYTWKKLDKKTIQINFIREIDNTPEKLILLKKKKQIIREGIFPQPNCTLLKIKR